ncbi:MAG: hypothetical protein V1802_01855 [Candidatus Aenigmatarchaeota archaeon]
MDNETKQILDDHEKRIRALEGVFKSEPQKGKKQISIKEFLLSKKPKDDVQRTLVICYYLEKHRGMSSFNAKDIEERFRDAKEKVPDNVNYKAIQNIKRGYMMEAKEKKDKFKAWTLTSTGERFVENDLKKE